MGLLSGYLAAEGFEDDLEKEIGKPDIRLGRLMIVDGAARPSIWAQNIWRNPIYIDIQSIKDAASKLKNIQRNWSLYEHTMGGRARLIQEQLPHVSARPIEFPALKPKAPLGSWALISEHQILASSDCSSSFRHGEVLFNEDRSGPPNRAYLKLWEILTLLERYPKSGEVCLDLGASPGGWTWVLAKLGCRVISIDKAPLASFASDFSNVEFHMGSAFALDPLNHEPVDWLFCDVVCYPKRLFALLNRWIESGKVKNFVATIKFQGETDHTVASQFLTIPGSEIRHLYHNKHELTWTKIS